MGIPIELLTDDVVELRLIRIMGPGDAAERPVNEQFLSTVPEYRFAIHRRLDGVRVGRINLRRTNDPKMTQIVGHCGYFVDEEHRRRGYAARAVGLIAGLAKFWNIGPFWILVEPDNIASRRTVERAGLLMVDVIDSPEVVMALGVGPKVCRYRSAE